MPPLTLTLIMTGVSGVLLALGYLVRPLRKAAGVLLLAWMAAALPILFFSNVPAQNVLLFYLLSGVLGLIFSFGGKKA